MPPTAYKLTIPKPCHNSWQHMTPNEKGRHCTACNKTVIDFTQLSDTDITNYFIQHSTQETCGRFYKKQLDSITIHLPTYILQKRLPAWKRFLVVLLICFGSSMFSIEVKAGNVFNHYTETTVKKAKTKVKKKKHRRRMNTCRIDMDMLTIISGNITPQINLSIPEYPIMGFTVDSEKPYPFAQPGYAETSFFAANSFAPGNNKKPSPFKKPSPPIEAILPIALAAKKRKRP